MKKNVAVVVGTTKNSAFAVANVIIGLERHSPRFVDTYYVYHDGLSIEDALALSRISQNIELVEYTQEDFLEKSKVAGLDTESLKRYTHMSFCRYEMFSLLENYRNAIWIDFDILVQKDISNILSYSPIGMLPAATPIEKALGAMPEDCDPELKCLSSGVIVVNESLDDYSSVTKELYQETQRYAGIATLPDQAVINYVLNRRGVSVKTLPDSFGCPPEWKKAKHSEMVHTPGKARRLWNEKSIYLGYPEWQVNNNIWAQLGGASYKGEFYNCYNAPEDFYGGSLLQYLRKINIFNMLVLELSVDYALVPTTSIWADELSFISLDKDLNGCTVSFRTKNKTQCDVSVFLTDENARKINVDELKLKNMGSLSQKDDGLEVISQVDDIDVVSQVRKLLQFR